MGARAIVASYVGPDPVRRALGQLHAVGVERDDISLLMTQDNAHAPRFGLIARRKWAEGMAYGAAIGGVLGGVVGAMVVLADAAGPDPIAGALGFAALIGVGLGGLFGSMLGALVGLRVPTFKARLVDESTPAGHVMIGVWVSDEARADRVQRILGRGVEAVRRGCGEKGSATDAAC